MLICIITALYKHFTFILHPAKVDNFSLRFIFQCWRYSQLIRKENDENLRYERWTTVAIVKLQNFVLDDNMNRLEINAPFYMLTGR